MAQRRLIEDQLDEIRRVYPGREFRTLRCQDGAGVWDPARIDELLSNLLGNAARHGGSGPIDVSLDGQVLGSVVADDTGRYAIDLSVEASRLGDGWHDLYLVFSTINEPEKTGRELRVARVERVDWSPAQ